MKLLHGDASPETASVFRAAILLAWVLKISLDPFQQLAELPLSAFHPVGPLRWMLPERFYPVFLGPGVLLAIKAAAMAVLFCALAGVAQRASLLAAAVLVTVHQALVRSFGFVNHAEIGLLYALYFLCLGAWTREERNGRAAWPFLATLFFILFSYHLTAAARLHRGGFDIFATDDILTWILDRSSRTTYYELGFSRWVRDSEAVRQAIRAGFPAVTIFEFFAPLCLVWRPFRLAFLAVILPFHLGVWFWENMLLCLFLLDLGRWFAPRRAEGAGGGSPPVIFFDGFCGLCDRFITRVLALDRTGVYRFAPLQGQTARGRLHTQAEPDPGNWAIVLADERGEHRRSGAVLRILSGLGGIWRLAGIGLLSPALLRDAVYGLVARNRYRLFKKLPQCRLPNPSERERFLP
jgi:predicted DCC family thiol-disulfide oxidoreductase YuxK